MDAIDCSDPATAPRAVLPPPSLDDPAVIRDVQAFREALQRGEAPDRDTLTAKYPAIADELSACLDALEFIHGAAPLFHASGPHSDLAALAEESAVPRGLLGDYRIVREVGRGGMGVVYEAEQVSLGRRVALKVLPFAAVMDPRQIGRFKNEALAAAQLDHPHIVSVYAVGSERGVHFYAMRYVDGRPLSAVIEEQLQRKVVAPAAETAAIADVATWPSGNERARFRTVAEIARQVADALDHAHRHGVVHRDVKPANLLLDDDGNTWVTDFGLARLATDANLTMTGDLVGTLRYMSPEQARGERAIVDHRTDIYSLGVTLYELLTLRPAVTGSDRQELLRQIAAVDPPPPRRLNRAIPAELETIVLKAITKEPTGRYATAQELRDDLQRYLDDRPVLARRTSVWNRCRKWSRRHKMAVRTVAGGLVLTVAITAGVVGWAVRDRAARQAETDREAAEREDRTNREVDDALREAALHRDHRDWPQATAAVQRAEWLLGSGGSDARRWKTRQMGIDLKMIARLDEIRLEVSLSPQYFGFIASRKLARAKYVRAFKDYGIDVSSLEAATAAKRIEESAIRGHLVAALDEWMFSCIADRGFLILKRKHRLNPRLRPKVSQQYEYLRHVAEAVAPNELQRRMRLRTVQRDRHALEALAARHDVAALPPSAALFLARLLDRAKSTSKAVEMLKAAQLRFPGDFALNQELASLLCWRIKPPKFEEAVGFMRTAVALRPKSGLAYAHLGAFLERTGQPAMAVTAFRTAIDVEPDNVSLHLIVGGALESMWNWNEAVAVYEHRVSRQPNAGGMHSQLARAYCVTGQWDKAIASLEKAVRLTPKSAPHGAYFRYHRELAWVLATCPHIRLRNASQALEHARTAAAAVQRNRADSWKVLGAAQFRAGHWNDAIASLERAKSRHRRTDPAIASIGFFLAMAHWQSGNRDEAARHYAETIKWMTRFKKQLAGRPLEASELTRVRAEAAQLLGVKYAPAPVPPELDLEKAYLSAARLLLAGDKYGYQRLCASMLEHSGKMKCNNLPWRKHYLLARVCLLAPAATVDPAEPAWLADAASRHGSRTAWDLHTVGLAHYRNGRYARAVKLLEQSIRAERKWEGQPANWIVLAMSHHALSVLPVAWTPVNPVGGAMMVRERVVHAQKAREWLRKATEAIDRDRKKNPRARTALGMHPHDWIACQLLRREAEQLINGGAK